MTAQVGATEERVVHEFPKNDREIVRAVVSTFKGRRYCSVRVFYRDNGRDGWLPSKKGLTLSLDLLHDLGRAVRALEETARNDGEPSEGRVFGLWEHAPRASCSLLLPGVQ